VIDYGGLISGLTKPDHYNPSDNARDDYDAAWRAVAHIPQELDNPHIGQGYPTRWSEEERQSVRNWVQANEKALGHIACGAKERKAGTRSSGLCRIKREPADAVSSGLA
jgi:hypothetical protein